MPLGEATGCTVGVRPAALALCVALFAVLATVSATVSATVLAVGLWASPLAAQTPQNVQLLARQAVQQLDLQTELRRQPEPVSSQLSLPPETLWLAVIVGVGVLLYAFRDMIPMLQVGRGRAWTDDEAGLSDLNSRAPEVVLGAADDLAAQGRFVEAMHVLLLRALAEIRQRLDEQFADSLTSREILRSRKLSDDLRHPLREVVVRVEWTYFGEHSANREDYLACRSSFSTLARALHGSAAA